MCQRNASFPIPPPMRLLPILCLTITALLCGCVANDNTPANRLRTVEQAFKGAEIVVIALPRYVDNYYVVREPNGTIWYVIVYSAGTIHQRQRLLSPSQVQPTVAVEAGR